MAEKTHTHNPDAPFAAYGGAEPYIFVSYARKDKDKVALILERLHRKGYRLWWDEGIEAGDEWFKIISRNLRRSACMLLFWSPEAAKSKWVNKEILIALNNDIRIAGSVITSADIPDILVDVQLLSYESFRDGDAFVEKLCKGLPLAAHSGPARSAPSPSPPPAIGSVIPFGSYPWRVLDVDAANNRALLLSENIIEKRAYNESGRSTTWAECSLRKYLNGEFYESFGEKCADIALTHNENPDNTWGKWKGKQFNTPGGKPTDDHVFLLSVPEVRHYFPGLKLNKDSDGDEWFYEADGRLLAKFNDSDSRFWWWLRSPGGSQSYAAFIRIGGDVGLFGNLVSPEAGGVRPALWINL